MITYLFHTTLLISGFTLFYWFILRHETYFRLNRWVILGSLLFCLILPLLQIPASLSLWKDTSAPAASILETIANAPNQIIAPSQTTPTTLPSTEPSPITTTSNSLSLTSILTILYIVGVVIFLLIFLVQVVILLTQRYNLNSFETGKYTIVEMVKDAEPCSFLNYIYINPSKYDAETYDHIIEHEKAHIDQSHVFDKIIAELLVAIFWFNPFTWLLRKSISQNLEFLTDQSLLKQGIQKDKYQMSLLKVSVANRPLNLTSSYNSSFLKNRIQMMNAKNSSIVASWKYMFILPLFLLSVAGLNAVHISQTSKDQKVFVDDKLEKENNKSPYLNGVEDALNDYETRTLELPHLKMIALGLSGTLILSHGSEQKITIQGPKSILDEVSTVTAGDNWQITYKKPGYRSRGNEITVFAQLTDLSHLALSGTGSIKTINKFENLNELFIALSGSGNIEFTGNAKSVNTALSGTGNILITAETELTMTALSGTGNITMRGSSTNSEFVCSGSGNISANQLETKSAKVVIDGSSTVSVHTTDHLDVTANGHTVVKYKGSPTIKKDLKSEARLEKIEW